MPLTPSKKLSIDFILNDESKSQKEIKLDSSKGLNTNTKSNTLANESGSSSHLKDIKRPCSNQERRTETALSSQMHFSLTANNDLASSSAPPKQCLKSFVCAICSRAFVEKGNVSHNPGTRLIYYCQPCS